MYALPLAISLLSALALAPSLIRALAAGGQLRPNYRGRDLPTPLGVLIPAAALTALVPLMLIEQIAGRSLFRSETAIVALYALGVIVLGLIDDTIGKGPAGGGTAPRASAATPRPFAAARCRRGR